jgi:hypothetical protein
MPVPGCPPLERPRRRPDISFRPDRSDGGAVALDDLAARFTTVCNPLKHLFDLFLFAFTFDAYHSCHMPVPLSSS